MLLPKTAHFAPGLRCDTITKNVYPGAAAMEYIMQRKQDGNTCGAFVLAYYQWEKTGCETVQEEAGRAYVEQLYWEIVFGSTMPGFETYSNPVLMMRWLAQQGTRPVFYLGENPLVQKMFAVLQASAGAEIAALQEAGMICREALDVCRAGGIFGAGVPDGRGRRACGQASLCADEKGRRGHAAYCKPVARAGAAGRPVAAARRPS